LHLEAPNARISAGVGSHNRSAAALVEPAVVVPLPTQQGTDKDRKRKAIPNTVIRQISQQPQVRNDQRRIALDAASTEIQGPLTTMEFILRSLFEGDTTDWTITEAPMT